MCGVAGFFHCGGSMAEGELRADLEAMSRTIEHRGPDDGGYWCDPPRGIFLAHRRLSIIDLTEQGAQPMVSAGGRYVISYNGEIYNFRELRDRLLKLGVPFRGDSDTEVLVNGIENWGVEKTLQLIKGMFAFVAWDRENRQLVLARDRAGEKPLYYGWVGNRFVFASELKAIRAMRGFCNPIARESVASFMRLSYVPCPHSIYVGIYKLPPGAMLEVAAEELRKESPATAPSSDVPGKVLLYWNSEAVYERLQNTYRNSDREAVDELDRLVRRSVTGQMISDVPLGALLSGGIDSSTIVAVMQSLSSRPVRTFTIGFNEREFNEAAHARRIAGYLGTDHTELYVGPREALDVVPDLASIYDEPFADSSQIPTYLVAKLARSSVTVALSGDGGDELFGGYTRYMWAERIWKNIRRMPSPLRRLAAAGLRSVSRDAWMRLYRAAEPLVPRIVRQRNAGEKIHALAGLLSEDNRESIYRHIVSHWRPEDALVLGGNELCTIVTDSNLWPRLEQFTQRMMAVDFASYLPDDILVKVDRASMRVSLETRVPLLDRDIVEFAAGLPIEYLVRDGQGKWILRQVLERYVPQELFDRPKMGFGVPVGEWLNGPLREWAEDLLDDGLLRRQGYLDPEVVRGKWLSHKRGDGNWQYHLWDVLMFQAWLAHEEYPGRADHGRNEQAVVQNENTSSPRNDISADDTTRAAANRQPNQLYNL